MRSVFGGRRSGAALMAGLLLLCSGCSYGSDRVDNQVSSAEGPVAGRVSFYNPDLQIMMLLDQSTSMAGRQDERNRAAHSLLNLLPDGCLVGGGYFDNGDDTNRPQDERQNRVGLLHLDNAARNQLYELFSVNRDVSQMQYPTNPAEALRYAQEQFENQGPSSSKRMVFLFTDGKPDDQVYPQNVQQYENDFIAAATELTQAGCALYIVHAPNQTHPYKTEQELTWLEANLNTRRITITDDNTLRYSLRDWDDGELCKLLSINEVGELSTAFRSIFYSLNNTRFLNRRLAANEPLSFGVPEIAVNKVQISLEPEDPAATVEVVGLTANGQALAPSSGASASLITADAGDAGFAPGAWELQLRSDGPVYCTVAMRSDFSASLNIPDAENSELVAGRNYPFDLSFYDSNGEAFQPDSSVTGILYGVSENSQPVAVELDGSKGWSGELPIPLLNNRPFNLYLYLFYENAEYGFSFNEEYTVVDTPPSLLKSSSFHLVEWGHQPGTSLPVIALEEVVGDEQTPLAELNIIVSCAQGHDFTFARTGNTADGEDKLALYPGRFPLGVYRFSIAVTDSEENTLEDEYTIVLLGVSTLLLLVVILLAAVVAVHVAIRIRKDRRDKMRRRREAQAAREQAKAIERAKDAERKAQQQAEAEQQRKMEDDKRKAQKKQRAQRIQDLTDEKSEPWNMHLVLRKQDDHIGVCGRLNAQGSPRRERKDLHEIAMHSKRLRYKETQNLALPANTLWVKTLQAERGVVLVNANPTEWRVAPVERPHLQAEELGESLQIFAVQGHVCFKIKGPEETFDLEIIPKSKRSVE